LIFEIFIFFLNYKKEQNINIKKEKEQNQEKKDRH